MKTVKSFFVLASLALLQTLLVTNATAATVTDDEYLIFYTHDMLGSPVAVSDDKGRVLWYENTEPFGKSLGRVSQSGEQFTDSDKTDTHSRVGYTGHEYDLNTDLVYMKARFYDADIGRFYSLDPVGFVESYPGTFARYTYVENNPYGATDPSGESGEAVFTELVPAAGRAFAGLLAWGVGHATDNQDLINVAIEGMAANQTDGLMAIGSVFLPPGASKLNKTGITGVTKKGLEKRGYKPAPGERTIQGQVDAATEAGNPTIQRGGQDLARLRSDGHGQTGATATPQNVRRETPDGRVITGKGPERAVTPRDIRELYKAQAGQGTSNLRTRSGR